MLDISAAYQELEKNKAFIRTLDRELYSFSDCGKAHKIMGRNMFDVEDATKYFGINPTRRQIHVLSRIPFSKTTLEECKDTHMLIAIFPLSIVEIQNKTKLLGNSLWCGYHSFGRKRGKVEWQLVPALLSSREKTSEARVMIYTIIGHYLATSERLFENVHVKCSDVIFDYEHVCVYFSSVGLSVSYC